MSKNYYRSADDNQSPARHSFSIAPAAEGTPIVSDFWPRALYVGTTGDIKMRLQGDPAGVFQLWEGVPAGAVLPVRPIEISNDIATTAGGFIGIY